MSFDLSGQSAKNTTRWLAGSLLMALVAMLAVLLFTPVGASAASVASVTITTPTVSYTGQLQVNGSGFAPNEQVSTWITTPGGQAAFAGYAYPDFNGNLSQANLDSLKNIVDNLTANSQTVPALPVGGYTLSLHGNTSNQTVTTTFSLTAASITVTASTYNGQISPIISAANFYPGEQVSVWATSSTGTVSSLGYFFADAQGNASSLPLTSFAGASGTYTITTHGNTSNESVLTNLTV